MGLIGAHVSIASGLHEAISRGEKLKCESIQIFLSSSRTWAQKDLAPRDIQHFLVAKSKAKFVKKVVAHNSYLLNLSTSDNTLRKRSIRYFIQALHHCEALGVEALITHPGAHLGAGEEIGIELTSKSLNEILAGCRGFRTLILLENTAGQGSCIGHRFEHLKQIAENTTEPERIFFCFDTQHAFAAGYDLRSQNRFQETFNEWNDQIGLKRIKAMHLNDALKDLNSRVDRHENISKGFLGRLPFSLLVNAEHFSKIPMVIETDPGPEDQKHRQDLKLLFSLRTESGF